MALAAAAVVKGETEAEGSGRVGGARLPGGQLGRSAASGESALVLLVTAMCASLRNATTSGLKLRCMRLLLELASSCDDVVRTQRVLPYLIAMLGDTSPLVRAEAISLTSRLLESVDTLQPSDTRLMPDYVLPALTRASADPEELVRCALASCMATLAETSKRFLEIAQWMRVVSLRREASGSGRRGGAGRGGTNNLMTASGGDVSSDSGESSAATLQSFDSEFMSLQEQVSKVVVSLVTDPSSTACVKRALLADITRLCVFMARQNTNDLLLPLLITFLNDRETALRVAFFESISGVCAFVGQASLQAFVMPCILQSLTDVEEAVVAAALASLCRLAEVSLHTRSSLIDIAGKIAPLLTHPSSWVRHGALGFFQSVGNHFSPSETYCLIRPILRPFLARPFLSLDSDHLAAALHPPVSRLAFDQALACAAEQQQQHSQLLASGGVAVPGAFGAAGAAGGAGGGAVGPAPSLDDESFDEQLLQHGAVYMLDVTADGASGDGLGGGGGRTVASAPQPSFP